MQTWTGDAFYLFKDIGITCMFVARRIAFLELFIVGCDKMDCE